MTRFLRTLPKTDEAQEAAKQLRRSANSARANYRSSRKGRSRKDFESKLFQESREVAAILTAAVRTAKKNSRRTATLPDS